MMSMGCVLGMLGCEDRMDSPAPSAGEGKPVEVTLHVGIADEVDAATWGGGSADTKAAGAGDQSAFDVRLIPAAATKAATEDALATAKPDSLYNLQLLQYDSNKNFQQMATVGTQDIGAALSITLKAANNCHLIIIARGASSAIPAISDSPTWSTLQGVLANYNTVTDLTNINDMPYFIHLPSVNVTDEGQVIQSADGKDARILLKRLAVRLTVNWVFGGTNSAGTDIKSNYSLKEIKLCQIPSRYYLMPTTESDSRFEGDLYPGSLIEYKDIRLKGDKAVDEGSLTTWMPANAKGKSHQVTHVNYRTKEYAYFSATYMEFVVDKKDQSERLYYRAYLGGKDVADFNLLENTNYNLTVRIQNADYRNDPRIQLLDQTPVKSTNLVPTSNCFMMRPGTNICFNPYLHEATDGTNTYLNDKTIGSVRVLWQNKDAGTSGDLVMGYAVNNETGSYNHRNLVNYTDIANHTQARVHVKVPVTQGGNAVIAAYDTNGTTILWSWHIWITDYVPVPLSGTITADNRTAAIETARAATAGGTVHTYHGASWTQSGGDFFDKVIMDRNLGAIRSTFSASSDLDAARSYGNLYQWGRKDPLPGSVDGSSKEIGIIFDGDGEALVIARGSGNNLIATIQNPFTYYKNLSLADYSWGPATKSIYDPCPKGWKVPDFYGRNTVHDMFQDFKYGIDNVMIYFKGNWGSSTINGNDNGSKNGFLYMYPGESVPNSFTDKSVWFPSTRLRDLRFNGNLRDSNPSMTMFSAHANGVYGLYTEIKSSEMLITDDRHAHKSYGMSVRCIQERR